MKEKSSKNQIVIAVVVFLVLLTIVGIVVYSVVDGNWENKFNISSLKTNTSELRNAASGEIRNISKDDYSYVGVVVEFDNGNKKITKEAPVRNLKAGESSDFSAILYQSDDFNIKDYKPTIKKVIYEK